MNFPAVPIFPEGSLSASVTTTVWIGVFILSFFNLRYGWTLSGLVVPGYLVPLLVVKPVAAVVIIVEGVLTYLLVKSLSHFGQWSGRWSNFFGRDRFFALLIVGIAVRIALDGYLLPWIARASMDTWLRDLDLLGNLHSFGLIIVSLIANQFWKPGLVRGIAPFAVTLGVTYLLVRFPLMHLTNFSIGSLEYMYEDIASSLLSSPKAYIVLIITAFIASRMNLYYSWDFNGILIPSLLALQWYEPLKVLTSFVEAWVIYMAGGAVLKLPMLKEATVEGARKILLFFNLSFAYKMLLGHCLHWIDPTIQATDFFGFGYLLTSLIALKMHDKGIPMRLTRTTLQVSLVGTLGASAIGFALTFLPQGWRWDGEAIAAPGAADLASARTLVEQLREDKIALYEQKIERSRMPFLPGELEAFSTALRSLRAFLAHGNQADHDRARSLLPEAGFELRALEDGLIYIRERPPQRGRGIYVIDPNRPLGFLVEVPAPLDEWATLESGAYLFRLFQSCGLAIHTAVSSSGAAQAGEALAAHRTFFNVFHGVFGMRETLQVRGQAESLDRSRRGGPGARREFDFQEPPSSLWVRSKLPAGINLAGLRKLLSGIDIEWSSPPFKNFQRSRTLAGFAELFLNHQDRKRLLARFLLGVEPTAPPGSLPLPDAIPEGATFQEWLFALKPAIAGRGSNLYAPPNLETLIFLDEEAVEPIVRLLLESRAGPLPPQKFLAELQAIQASLGAVGYEILRHREESSAAEYLILREKLDAFPRRHWGTYVFRLHPAEPYLIEVPHPIYEMNTFEYGISLFERLSAQFLFIAGSHPKANRSGNADVVLPENKRSFFNLVHQVTLRESGELPQFVVQVRALGPMRGVVLPAADALLAMGDSATDRAGLGALALRLIDCLEEERLVWRFVDGSPLTAGYEAQGSAQAMYLAHTRGKEFAALWLSPLVRIGYRQLAETSAQQAQFTALDVETEELDLCRLLAEARYAEGPPAAAEEILELLEHYYRTQDINTLHSIRTQWPRLRLRRVLDTGTRKAFLLIEHSSGLLPLVMNLTWNPRALLRDAGGASLEAPFPPARKALDRFIESGALFLRSAGER